MKKDIYSIKPVNKTEQKAINYYSLNSGEIKNQLKKLENLEKDLTSLKEITNKLAPVIKVHMPKVQDVKVTNPLKIPEQKEIDFTKIESLLKEIKEKDIDFTKMEALLTEIRDFKVNNQETQKVMITNPPSYPEPTIIPVGEGNIPGKADPEKYVPVRLTDGKKFYSAVRDAYVAAAKASKEKPWATFPIDALSNTPVVVNTTNGEFGGYYYFNPNSSPAYIQLFKTANPTVGTTAHNAVYGIPANAGANIEFKRGVDVGPVFSVAATTTASGASAPSSAIVVTLLYS
jgi:hypothetical protein